MSDTQEWRPPALAPYHETVEVRVGTGMIFRAKLLPDAAMTDEEQSCDQWVAAEWGEHPPCWSEGACWTSNENEDPSLPVTAWRPLSTPHPGAQP